MRCRKVGRLLLLVGSREQGGDAEAQAHTGRQWTMTPLQRYPCRQGLGAGLGLGCCSGAVNRSARADERWSALQTGCADVLREE